MLVGTGLDLLSFDAPIASHARYNLPPTGGPLITLHGLNFDRVDVTPDGHDLARVVPHAVVAHRDNSALCGRCNGLRIVGGPVDDRKASRRSIIIVVAYIVMASMAMAYMFFC
jgi:hypothetical protein